MHLFYYNFDLEDWKNIVLTVPFMYKESEFIYSIWENAYTLGLPAIIELYNGIEK